MKLIRIHDTHISPFWLDVVADDIVSAYRMNSPRSGSLLRVLITIKNIRRNSLVLVDLKVESRIKLFLLTKQAQKC